MPASRTKRAAPGSKPIQCPYTGCSKILKTRMGLTYHVNSIHRNPNALPNHAITPSPSPPGSPIQVNDDDDPMPAPPPLPALHVPPQFQKNYHPFLDGRPCNAAGEFLPEGTPPPPRTTAPNDDWSPYDSEVQFKVADFLFRRAQMSAGNIDFLLEWEPAPAFPSVCPLYLFVHS
ncbi:hypothetical protein B0H14DRAFT_3494311 [Mycena olivaceomarginata]|nr:hypothetical protein B0H14DRAFT_3494311 [Mycena olivaceomarginata]